MLINAIAISADQRPTPFMEVAMAVRAMPTAIAGKRANTLKRIPSTAPKSMPRIIGAIIAYVGLGAMFRYDRLRIYPGQIVAEVKLAALQPGPQIILHRSMRGRDDGGRQVDCCELVSPPS